MNSGYSARTLSIYDIVGSYFVNLFFNDVYSSAVQQHKSNQKGIDDSLTSSYKVTLVAFNRTLKKENDYYEKTIKGMVDYYRKYTKNSTISMKEFIHELLQQYVPAEHYSTLTNDDKATLLRYITLRIIDDFTEEIFDIEMIRMVIDDHDKPENGRIWVDKCVEIQITIREEMYHKLIESENKKRGDDAGMVRKITAEKAQLWIETQKILRAKCELEEGLARAKKIAEVLYSEVASGKKTIEELTAENTKLKEECEALKSEIKRQGDEIRKHTDESKKMQVPEPVIEQKPVERKKRPVLNIFDNDEGELLVDAPPVVVTEVPPVDTPTAAPANFLGDLDDDF